jgi:Protein of unknown function (DUF2510)
LTVATPGATGAPEGWYPSAEDPDLWRYWNGDTWTAERRRPLSRLAVGATVLGASTVMCTIVGVVFNTMAARCAEYPWLSAAEEECENGIPDPVFLVGVLNYLLLLPFALLALVLGAICLIRVHGVRDSRWAWAGIAASVSSVLLWFASFGMTG